MYRAREPRVAGMGLAAIGGVVSDAKDDPDCPLPVERGVAIGISQTGRFLRHFLDQGFQTDAAGRQAYDGMLVLTAGTRRGSFKHCFALPGRDAHRCSAFSPTNLFPFHGRLREDPLSGRSGGRGRRAKARPRALPRACRSSPPASWSRWWSSRFPRYRSSRCQRRPTSPSAPGCDPDWAAGRVRVQPLRLGPPFPSFVPQVDAGGLERAGLRPLEVRVSLATLLPRQLGTGEAGSPEELRNFAGNTAPLAARR